jgi:hypothetical protein
VSKLGGGDETISVLIENLEGLKDFLLTVGILHLAGHHCQEFWEVDSSTAISIDLKVTREDDCQTRKIASDVGRHVTVK